MRLAGQLSASMEVLGEVLDRHRPASIALADWGRSHRFAGSRDRSAIGTLVYDALRKRSSLAWRMGNESPRALALGVLRFVWNFSADEIAGLCDGSQYAPTALTGEEIARLGTADKDSDEMPPHIRADIPQWLFEEFSTAFGDRAIAEGKALAERAPIDLRVNTLKADRAKTLKVLQKYGAEPTPLSPIGIRIPVPGPQEKNPNVEAETAHGRGWFEVQDEASQIAVFLSGAAPRRQVLDLCAGSGGKTLGIAALMQNTGQIYAYDADKQRLRPIIERLKRSGARNVQVLPAGDEASLDGLTGRMDVVFVDAPCSGSGVWRRRPDAKWRLTAEALRDRIGDQRRVLELAAKLVKPGGQLIYGTCSVLPSENFEQMQWFLERWPEFTSLSVRDIWQTSPLGPAPEVEADIPSLQLTPSQHGTDGFYIGLLQRSI